MTSSCPNCGAHLSIVRAQDARNTIIGTSPAPQPRNSEQPSDADSGTPTSDSSWDTLTDSSKKDLDSSKKDLDSSKKDLDSSRKDLGFSKDRRKLKELICSNFCDNECKHRPNYPTFRQFLSEDVVGAVKPGSPRETLDRVTNQMEAAIRRAGKCSVDALLTSRRLGRSSSDGCVGRTERVFQAIGAIVYDMEWTSSNAELEFEDAGGLADATGLADAANTISPTFKLGDMSSIIFELILLIDYGFPVHPLFDSPEAAKDSELDSLWSFERFSGFLTAVAWRWKKGHAIPDQEAWDFIIYILETSGVLGCGCYTWDAAIMFYYYYSRREFVATFWYGRTGYTGVLQEMVDEVPIRGTDRLERKLSLDVHYLIPTFIKDQNRRVQMISIAKDLARRHGCKLELPNMAPPDKVLPATSPPERLDTWSGFEWLGLGSSFLPSIFSFTSPGARVRDGENRGENEKLLEGLEKEGSGEGGVDVTDKLSEKASTQRLHVVEVEQDSGGRLGDEEML